MDNTKENTSQECGRTPIERMQYHLQELDEELTDLRRQIATASDPTVIYRRNLETTSTIVGESYLAVDHRGKISYVDPTALKIMGLQEKEVIGRDYSKFVTENPLPEEAGIKDRRKEGLLLMLDNKNIIRLGPCAVFHSSFPGDKKEYGAIIKVAKGPDIPFVTRVMGMVSRHESAIDKHLSDRKKEKSD